MAQRVRADTAWLSRGKAASSVWQRTVIRVKVASRAKSGFRSREKMRRSRKMEKRKKKRKKKRKTRGQSPSERVRRGSRKARPRLKWALYANRRIARRERYTLVRWICTDFASNNIRETILAAPRRSRKWGIQRITHTLSPLGRNATTRKRNCPTIATYLTSPLGRFHVNTATLN